MAWLSGLHLDPEQVRTPTDSDDGETEGPIWALHLIRYRKQMSVAARAELDRPHSPHDDLHKLGSRIIMVAGVDNRGGSRSAWDAMYMAHFRDRAALIEMATASARAKDRAHYGEATESSVVLLMFPERSDPTPSRTSAVEPGRRLLLQLVVDGATPDVAEYIDSARVGRFRVERHASSDERTFVEARFDVIMTPTVDQIATGETVDKFTQHGGTMVVAKAGLDDIARSLQDPTRVRF